MKKMNLYAELARYVDEEGLSSSLPVLERRALASRRLVALVKASSQWLKLLAHYGLITSLLAMFFVLFWPLQLIYVSDFFIQLFVGSTIIKIFSPLMDLETRFVQFALVGLVVFMMYLVQPELWQTPIFLGLFFICFIKLTLFIRHFAKIRQATWMVALGKDLNTYVKTKNEGLSRLHKELGIDGFDDETYYRSFDELKSGLYVRIWQRDPLVDLSSFNEFCVCCFLGGSQDGSAFDFILSRAITMLDFGNSKGRKIRVLLMACHDDEKNPILVVNAVFGCHKGLLGGSRRDDKFIYEQILAYGKHAGFDKVIFNLAPTNSRPRQFIKYLLRKGFGDKASLWCQLPTDGASLKVEIFNRQPTNRSVYVTLLKEIMGVTDNYGSEGFVTGLFVPFPRRERVGLLGPSAPVELHWSQPANEVECP